ncbi:hypothetical protein Sme01_42960 [Sphaerisporangium melleum]|uniref:Metalloprotease n=1 Tax=Sphaerisporangium melleum TaxID=321316 RepID=A0A917VG16_9ACTN|nr:neutral zinc metallopeptidase [Sphaerisporangium melleum]GGK77201.1 hypothetical protein GCM10007964_19920 [Sphaerisporangium melleum]GII71820.1 hypothetical protein Sme01_42960 [Sphaerisporangium melleum]
MTPRVVVSFVLAALLTASCAPSQPDSPEQPPVSSTPDAAESATSEPDPGPSQPLGQTLEEDVELARTLAERYWEGVFQSSGRTYRPLTRFEAYSGSDGPDCGGQPAVPENAFYCPVGHFVAYDRQWLQSLYDEKGDGAVYVIIPHEIGHAVQAQLMSDFTLNRDRELQADCYAGVALKGIIDAGQLQAEDGDEEELLTNLAAAGDPTDAWWRPDAHGTPVARQQAFARGYNDGIDAC